MDHVDVVIVGAGLSGIGAAVHLQERCPSKTYAILEAREATGGTWDLFRYPGIRSDSDMYTLGYRFRPWPGAKAIADGPSILSYVRDTARDHDIDRHIRFGHKVVRAEWSTDDARWTVETEQGESLTCNFLLSCSGYYSYDNPYSPEFPGAERFRGEIVHPQHWRDDIEYAGKRVVVIGSGATAVTLVPAMAERAKHVTMLQRSPSYVISLPGEDPIANVLRRLLPPKAAYFLVRWKNVIVTSIFFQLSRRRPRLVKGLLRRGVEAQLPEGYAVDTHFKPRYNPWDQRVCLVPDGDLFEAISRGRATIATDEIDTFTESGIRLKSGEELEADLIVTATGLNMLPLGGMDMVVDGEAVSLPDRLTYKGMMVSGAPNYMFALGYTNASWTLKCDLTCEYACRVLNHLDEHGHDFCVPRNTDPSVTPQPAIDFSSGYVQRSIHLFPKQGSKWPWKLRQNYPIDVATIRHGAIDDGALQFGSARVRDLVDAGR